MRQLTNPGSRLRRCSIRIQFVHSYNYKESGLYFNTCPAPDCTSLCGRCCSNGSSWMDCGQNAETRHYKHDNGIIWCYRFRHAYLNQESIGTVCRHFHWRSRNISLHSQHDYLGWYVTNLCVASFRVTDVYSQQLRGRICTWSCAGFHHRMGYVWHLSYYPQGTQRF